MPKAKGRGQPPNAAEQARVTYPVIRDRFLAISDEGEYAEWLIQVGRYIHHCWLAEEQDRKPGEPLDEEATKRLWDQCSELELRNLRSNSLQWLQDYRTTKWEVDLNAWYEDLNVNWKIGAWLLKTMAEGFVGGLGLIVLGLVLVWLEPHLIKTIRATIDDALPAATSPRQDSKPLPAEPAAKAAAAKPGPAAK